MRPEVLAYYRRMGELTRLERRGTGRLEFLRTWDILTRELPPPPAAVLDVGGATGVYAGPLAKAGYAVHVVDPVPEHVDAAGALPGVTASVGDARSLEQPDASVDAVLLFGPMYHLTETAERIAAWREAGRVVRPGGVIVAAAISRYASMIDGYAQGFYADPEYAALVRGALRSGRHEPSPDDAWFTTAYFHHPDELAGEISAAGLTFDRLVIVEGPLGVAGDRIDPVLADEARARTLVDELRSIEDEPALRGATGHLLAIARRPADVGVGPGGVSIRPMQTPDADQVLAIYQAGIDTGNATFTPQAPTWADFDADHLAEHRYVAVDTDGQRLLGWVAVAPVSKRPVYAGVVEHSVYVHPDAHGRGVGGALLRALIASTDAGGVWTLTTHIFPENTASLALHRRAGFRVVGRRERLGRMRGVWRDVLLLERRSPIVE